MRGIDTLTALALVAEIGDFKRFRTAEELMAFVGLVPSEHSSGERRRQGSITVERAWRCQQRLFQRWQRMAGRGKPQQKIVVACARELAGFVWAIATDQPLRSL